METGGTEGKEKDLLMPNDFRKKVFNGIQNKVPCRCYLSLISCIICHVSHRYMFTQTVFS